MDLPEGIACPFPSAMGTIFKGRGWVISDIVGRKTGKHQSWKQRCFSLCWKFPDRAQSFLYTNLMRIFYFVSKFEMIGMLLNIVHRQVQES